MYSRNATIDVASKGCFSPYDEVACIRNCILITLIFGTLLLCVIRIIRLHIVKHPQVHQYIIFYFATVECILCAVNWIIGGSRPELDISASYVKLLQFIIMSHFYWTLAARILHKEHLVYQVIMPILSVYVMYFSAVAIVAIVLTTSSWTECLKPEWLMMSAAEFLIVQLFMLAGRYITVKINTVSAVESFKRAQKRDLWCLIIAYEMSALVGVIYDSLMRILGNDATGCSGIFGHVQLNYSLIFATFMVIKYMIPIWTMLLVFKVSTARSSEDDGRFLQWSNAEPTTSVFNNQQPSNPYKKMYAPSANQDSGDISEVYPPDFPDNTGSNKRDWRNASTSSLISSSSQSKLLPSINGEAAIQRSGEH